MANKSFRPCNDPPPPKNPAAIDKPTLTTTTRLPLQSSRQLESRKAVKRGFKSFHDPKVCGLSFERLPAWLWTLRPAEWSSILLSESDKHRLHQTHPILHKLYLDKFRVVNSPGCNSVGTEADVWWISGSHEFIMSLMLPSGVPTVAWVTGSSRRSPIPSTPSNQWLNVSHSKVGGCTTCRGKFSLNGLSSSVEIANDLTRTIGHIIKYSLRSKPCPVVPETSHYCLSSKLSVNQLHKVVVVPSNFSATGWGCRLLEPAELANAFELPDYLEWDSTFAMHLVPLQILRSVMDAVLEMQRPPAQLGRVRQCRRPSTSLTVSDGDREWIPSLGRWLAGTWADIPIAEKAVKADDAEVNVSPWHMRISLIFPCRVSLFDRLTRFAMRRWRYNVIRSFFTYLRCQYGTDWPSSLSRKRPRSVASDPGGSESGGGGGTRQNNLLVDLTKGLAVLGQVTHSTWWEWSSGSSLLFWRWNGAEQIKAARDGMRIYVRGPLPKAKRLKPLRLPGDQLALVTDKIEGMIARQYLSVGPVKSCLHFFAVPKGPTDVRIVYDGTSCGLNDALWAPNFYLPSSKAAAILLTFSSWLADADYGEMFHNFFMDEKIRKHAGVDLSKLKHRSKTPSPTVRWTRLFMGMKSSPYNAVRHYYWGEEVSRGNPKKRGNPMGYSRVRLNLPGSSDYDPGLPKVMKWNDSALEGTGAVSGDVITFVDDVRIVGHSKSNCHAVHRQFTSRMQFMGLQDAPRKFRPPSQNGAGAWTGTIFRVGPDSISKSVSVEKWKKGLAILTHLEAECLTVESRRPLLNRKQLERDVGFLNHLSMTFEETTPFLKGFYLTLNSWRPYRDDDDWKMTQKAWDKIKFHRMENSQSQDEWDRFNDEGGQDNLNAPDNVVASSRFANDVGALLSLLNGDGPPVTQLRSRFVISVIFGFGDASGTGLGATFTCGTGFTFRVGVWGSLEKDESSNWKEFSNVVESLEEEAEAGGLDQSEVFMFTDNTTVEACSYKGSSSSPRLLSLIIRLKAMATRHGIRLHIFHVSGTRMIAQGTDGVSRGCLSQGVMGGEAMTAFIPIHQSAVERSPRLLPWVRSWSGSASLLLTPEGWFQEGHDIDGWLADGRDQLERPRLAENRTYIWSPPPYAADVAIAELRKARIKRQTSSHIVIVPRLCCSLWMKQLYRTSDIVFQVLPGSEFWTKEMHEPILIGILFPFLRSRPWQLRGTPKMFAVGRQLRGMPEDSEMDRRNLLCKFWTQCHELRYMSETVVRRVLLIR